MGDPELLCHPQTKQMGSFLWQGLGTVVTEVHTTRIVAQLLIGPGVSLV